MIEGVIISNMKTTHIVTTEDTDANGWISVDDRLPKKHRNKIKKQDILISNEDDDVAVGWYDGYFNTWDDRYDNYSKTIWWMPIPRRPKIEME